MAWHNIFTLAIRQRPKVWVYMQILDHFLRECVNGNYRWGWSGYLEPVGLYTYGPNTDNECLIITLQFLQLIINIFHSRLFHNVFPYLVPSKSKGNEVSQLSFLPSSKTIILAMKGIELQHIHCLCFLHSHLYICVL